MTLTSSSGPSIHRPLEITVRGGQKRANGLTLETEGQGLVVSKAHQGPCSRVWEVPKKARKKRTSKDLTSTGPKAKTGFTPAQTVRVQNKRKPFRDLAQRSQTAVTRRLRGCMRCRILRIRCKPNPEVPEGICLTCQLLYAPRILRRNSKDGS
ncbi:hypothetical protein HYQ45_002386 [Verticillium longisporum]|uniref:Uncharacterized protein n=1 Tax=Verticillium longisporum TaxID=100787 RepID=A0A8I3AYE8_VERLO|nr:hypothetical protein HYQ45_002386 [Verticillium longisporum]